MDIALPSKMKVISEEGDRGVYEIEGLYPGYGHTLGNSLRRILLSSLPGAAITAVKIDGVDHEFSTVPGVKEDVINILLNLKNVRIKMHTDEPQILKLSVKGAKKVTAEDIKAPSQVEIVTKDAPIATITSKDGKLNIEMTVERGIGYVPREVAVKDKVEIGTLVLDAIFTPVRRVSYDVENMRVGGRIDFNRLRVSLQTDGTIAPRAAFDLTLDIMIKQLAAVAGLSDVERLVAREVPEVAEKTAEEPVEEDSTQPEKMKIDDLQISARVISALQDAGIKTIGGLIRKKAENLAEIEGIGAKAIVEIKDALDNLGLALKE
ncbi:MAG: DNA-directed RNA polymerase subunit alpha [Candidatus Niyogibacteria bacterium]|nr:DNA-directed RNA polymerase subunit alpha [Candidatus Niyogibacteria bacterium]